MKCLCCKEIFVPDRRNHHHQQFCSKAPCQQASKRHSQQRWLAKAENKNYFSGPAHVQRVRQWRQEHPGYWRNGTKNSVRTLQEVCSPQVTRHQGVAAQSPPDLLFGTLQDVCKVQVPLLVGLAAATLGPALQEDIVPFLRRLVARGEDLLDRPPRGSSNKTQNYDQKNTPAPRPVAADPAAL
jgi:hypothetical protein